ncbi:MAG: glycosyltransferase family 2 protein [Gemmatimonadota bacterium]|nr:glycosyltransferase family 2 protein [Gemmatimonadota bacterium]
MIYICIPTHNEASTIGVLLWKVRKVLSDFGRPFYVVVYDDASTDDTAEVLQRYKWALPLTTLRSEKQIGYGRSVETLLRHVQNQSPYPKRDCAVIMQADFTENPEGVVSLVKALEGGADIVAGKVHNDGGVQPRVIHTVRRFAARILRSISSGIQISDPAYGLRAYRVIVLKKAFRDRPPNKPLIHSDGWAANVELIKQLAPHARRITEVPVELRYDLQVRPSRFRPLKTLLSLIRQRGVSTATTAEKES